MIGISIDELKDALLHGHEAEFTYNHKDYSIESANSDSGYIVKIWEIGSEPMCISERHICDERDLMELFEKKCFQGKSFLDIESRITVKTIF